MILQSGGVGCRSLVVTPVEKEDTEVYLEIQHLPQLVHVVERIVSGAKKERLQVSL